MVFDIVLLCSLINVWNSITISVEGWGLSQTQLVCILGDNEWSGRVRVVGVAFSGLTTPWFSQKYTEAKCLDCNDQLLLSTWPLRLPFCYDVKEANGSLMVIKLQIWISWAHVSNHLRGIRGPNVKWQPSMNNQLVKNSTGSLRHHTDTS